MMRIIYILFVWLCAVGLMSACEDKEVVTSGSVTGNVVDSVSNTSLSGVTVTLSAKSASVEMEEQVQQSNYSGEFIFENLQSGRYTLTIEKKGYFPASGEILVLGSEVQVPCRMVRDNSNQPEIPDDPAGPDVYVEVERYFTLSDGVYFYFNPSAGVSYYFWDFWKIADVPASEEKIINDLLLRGVRVEVDEEDEEGYGYNLQPNTRYKYYILAYDEDKVQGKRLVSGEFTTSSDVSQPMAVVELKSSNDDTLYLDVTRNKYCSGYYMRKITDYSHDIPDIRWAVHIYDDYLSGDKEMYYDDDFKGKWWNWPLAADNAIITWGVASDGKFSGVLSKTVFRLPLNANSFSLPLRAFKAEVIKPGKAMCRRVDSLGNVCQRASVEVCVPFRN